MIGLEVKRVKKSRSSLTKISKMLSSIEKEKEKIKKKENNIAKSLIKELKNIIKSSDMIKTIRWTQYTPYFDDGNPVVFSVNNVMFEFYPETNDMLSRNRVTIYEHFVPEWDLPKLLIENTDIVNHEHLLKLKELTTEIIKIHDNLQDLTEPLYEIFGDHAEVLLTKDGIDVKTLDHE